MSEQDDDYYYVYYQPYYVAPSGGFAILVLIGGAISYISDLIAPYGQLAAAYWPIVKALAVIALVTLGLLAMAILSTAATWPIARWLRGMPDWDKRLWKVSYLATALSIVSAVGYMMLFSARYNATDRTFGITLFVIASIATTFALHAIILRRTLNVKKALALGASNIVALVAIEYVMLPRII